MMRARNRRGFGWERWSTQWLHATLGLFSDYRTRLDARKTARCVRWDIASFMEKYQRAWETSDEDLLVSLFSK